MRRLNDSEMKELAERLFPRAFSVYGNEFNYEGRLTVGQILTASDWIRGLLDNKPFSMRWLQENLDMTVVDRSGRVCVYFEDIISDQRGEAGHLDIVYNAQLYWSVGKGTSGTDWLCTCSNSWRNDDWIPSIKTVGDFKRLWRVATGFELPLKNA